MTGATQYSAARPEDHLSPQSDGPWPQASRILAKWRLTRQIAHEPSDARGSYIIQLFWRLLDHYRVNNVQTRPLRFLTRSGIGALNMSTAGKAFMRSQHRGEIDMQSTVAHARQHFAQLSHYPTLAAIHERDALAQIADRHRLCVEGTHIRGGLLTEGFKVTVEHGAPARFVSLKGPQQFSERTVAGCACGLERDPRSGTLRLEQLVEESGHLV